MGILIPDESGNKMLKVFQINAKPSIFYVLS